MGKGGVGGRRWRTGRRKESKKVQLTKFPTTFPHVKHRTGIIMAKRLPFGGSSLPSLTAGKWTSGIPHMPLIICGSFAGIGGLFHSELVDKSVVFQTTVF